MDVFPLFRKKGNFFGDFFAFGLVGSDATTVGHCGAGDATGVGSVFLFLLFLDLAPPIENLVKKIAKSKTKTSLS